jgi:nicotinate-nucleotide adenylyltransferase
MKEKKKIGLFGGTFNPIHFGHISLAIDLKEKRALDEVWLVPSLLSPFRMQENFPAIEHRLNMLSLAVSEISCFHLCDLELKRPPPSYTIDTIYAILNLYPAHSFFLLFGEDSLMRFSEWKQPEEIVRLMPLLIGSRPSSQLVKLLPKLGFDEKISSVIKENFIPTKQMEISATEIRDRLQKGLYCGHLLPGKVLDYIYENQLYSTSQKTPKNRSF